MANYTGANSFGMAGGFNISNNQPIDSRIVVNSIEDVIQLDNWQKKTGVVDGKPTLYAGLIVADKIGNVRVLVNPDAWDSMDSWIEISGGAKSIQSESDPTINDDESQDYKLGQLWINTTSKHTFVLLDATTGAAVWKQIVYTDSLGTAASKNVGTAEGNVPVLGANGKLDTSVLPALALTDTTTVDDMGALIAQTTQQVQKGDITIVTDAGNGVSKTFILTTDDPSRLENWKEILTPTSGVTSVNSKKGDVVLTTDDINEGSKNQYYTEERATANFESNWGKKTTDNLTEGTKKFYADSLVETFLKGSTFILQGSNAAGTWS